MKIYVAASWRDERQPQVVQRLRDEGHDVYDFRNPGDGHDGFRWTEIDPEWLTWNPQRYRDALDHERAHDGFGRDMAALEWCEACVHIVPDTAGRSSHLELGWAAGAGKRTIILFEGGEPELMYKMADYLAISLDEVVAYLRRWDGPARYIPWEGPK